MAAKDNVQVVKSGYAAFDRRDIPGLVALLSEDVEWHTPGAGSPIAGTYRGRHGVTEFFQKLDREFEVLEFHPREFIAEGDRVLVVGSERMKSKSTNRVADLDWIMAFTVRNGKVTNFREYTDTQAIATACAKTAQAAS